MRERRPRITLALHPGYSSRQTEVQMIVIEHNGKTTAVGGWRAWLMGALAIVVTAIILGAAAFLVLGIAVSVLAFLLILIPAIAIVVLVGRLFQPRPPQL
jgi:hypothetical protein